MPPIAAGPFGTPHICGALGLTSRAVPTKSADD